MTKEGVSVVSLVEGAHGLTVNLREGLQARRLNDVQDRNDLCFDHQRLRLAESSEEGLRFR